MTEIRSRSRFLDSNGTDDRVLDGEGKAVGGEAVSAEGVILRFIDGLLDGDRITGRGRHLSLPAVEAPGHLEWWRKGRLHRDGGLPAVVSVNFTVLEWWEDGRKLL
jgi:hypothetical protein